VVDVDELPLTVLKKLKKWPKYPEQSQSYEIGSPFSHFTAICNPIWPYMALSSTNSTAATAKPPDSMLPSLMFPQGLSTKPKTKSIYSPYDAVPTDMAIDMEASLSPIRKYYRSVQSSAMTLQGLNVTASTQEDSASTETIKGEDNVPLPKP
jgi:hypothetical protein